ncbi:MAG: zinc ribbon domain-containing protein, partial [Atopobium sp.]|nr:zinc ribbon domain-containing protein [Atopobium sp.]
MNCPNCGAEVDKHAELCSNCGQKFSDVADAADIADVEKPDALAESTEPTLETSLLEMPTDDSYITPDEALTVVANPTAVADPTAVSDADPTVIADSNAAAEEPTTFINDPDRINVFTPTDYDSTAISHFDPSQFTVVSSGPSSVERKQTKDGSDALRKVAFGLLAAVLVIGVLAVAWVFQSHQDNAAQRNAVQQRIASYQEQIESVNVDPHSDSSRVELLN